MERNFEVNNSANLSIASKCFKQYNFSLQNSSDATSSLLLTTSWNEHVKVIENCNIMQTVDNMLLENKNSNHIKSWKSSLSNMDPECIFEKSLPFCQNCSYKAVEHKYLNNIRKNICKCVPKDNENDQDNIVKVKCHSLFLKPISEERNKAASFEEPKSIFKPKFAKLRNINKTNMEPSTAKYTTKIPREMEYDIEILDEDKAHSKNVAKITFKTAREQFLASNPAAKRTLGASRKAQNKFISPMIAQQKQETSESVIMDERLKHLDPKMIELIESEIIDKGTPIAWDDIAGLELAKSVIQEAVVWPLLRPDIFTGLRRPPKGILLFGPPGTGKTLIGKCVAAQCHATFFSISASSLTSKWIGDGEKMVRALFAVARCHQPAVIFIDEIDSLLTQRNDTEHEATRRIKTEFLVQFDGAATGDEDRLLIVGATNRPQELDEAARRRLVKRLYIPLPDLNARKQIISNLLGNESNILEEDDIEQVSTLTDGYSGADMMSLCSEAAMGPIRSVPLSQIVTIQCDKVRPVNVQDFLNALERVKPSVSQDDLGQYVKWNKTYGQGF